LRNPSCGMQPSPTSKSKNITLSSPGYALIADHTVGRVPPSIPISGVRQNG
jgi:hypothetical protein